MYIFISIVLIALLTWFLFRKKNKVIVLDETEKSAYKELLDAHIDYYQKLSDLEKSRFENLINEFLSGVTIEGVGTEVTATDKVLIASSAIIPIFGLGDWQYKNLTNIILYPDTFDKEFQFEGENRNILGMVGSGYMNGQMLLSRSALSKGFSASAGKENTAIHEFVHLLDNSDGTTDGVPENLMAHQYVLPWLNMMHQEMHRIKEGKSDINPYALTNEAEFLAVAAEYFFEKPEKFQHMHPRLYDQLSLIFNQKPVQNVG
ncbi:zinc-dependent peptidase [Mucilaginibacter sp.]|uniref:M90 family metallopeptidase n=1 Tax=Mucilaginibacter sp. TaxID=1882438 RepID=UPI003D11B8DF